ncbi:hypothetical protein C1646_664476 [Rhizophagus diaphanus]|nr:hypothetical protein C1646_664476 [Rhizophagus diaphanus] [Rhizophagus sp. MUCL 43196]
MRKSRLSTTNPFSLCKGNLDVDEVVDDQDLKKERTMKYLDLICNWTPNPNLSAPTLKNSSIFTLKDENRKQDEKEVGEKRLILESSSPRKMNESEEKKKVRRQGYDYQTSPTKILSPPLYTQTLPLPSTTSNYATYKNPKAGLKFIESISYIIESQIVEEINKSTGWSILLDESTTITIDKHLAILSKHMVGNEPVLRYLGMINLEKCDANSIMRDIKIFLNAKGKNNGVVTQLENKNPFIAATHCIAHRFAFVGKDSAKDVPFFRFPDAEFHHSMRIFDAQQLPLTQSLINKYGEKEIIIIEEFYGSQKTDQGGNIYEPVINKIELEKEWVIV